MRLRPEFVATQVATNTLLIPTGDAGFNGMVRGNKTFAAIVELLRDDTTEEAVVAAMCARFNAPQSVIEADVSRAIAKLRETGALEE